MKLERRKGNYNKAMSFDVLVEVTYRRTRRVRAFNLRQAREFAREREEAYAKRRYDKMNNLGYGVKKVSSVKASPQEEKSDD